jgi:hypothetical protein
MSLLDRVRAIAGRADAKAIRPRWPWQCRVQLREIVEASTVKAAQSPRLSAPAL